MIDQKELNRIQHQAAMEQAARQQEAVIGTLFHLLGRCTTALEILALRSIGDAADDHELTGTPACEIRTMLRANVRAVEEEIRKERKRHAEAKAEKAAQG